MDKAYLRRALIYAAAAILSVALIVYIGYHVRKYFTREVETVAAKYVEQTFTVRCDAYVFRREETIPAPSGGSLAPSVADGSHVHSGEEVAVVYSVSDPQAEANLAAAREQLALLEDCAATKRGAKDAAAVDSRIHTLLTQMKLLTAQNDLTGVCEMRSELLTLLAERDVVSGVSSSGSFDELIAQVNATIAAEKAKLGSPLATVTAASAGWYYSAADGFETVFDSAKIDSLTPESFDELVAAAPLATEGTAGKMAYDFKWYLAAKTDGSRISGLEEGTSVNVSFAYNGGASLRMVVERIVPDDSGKALVVLSATTLTPGASFARCQTVDITVERVSGLSVPRSAVRLVDGVEGVYVFDGVYANFRRIVILREYEDSYVVKSDAAIAAELAEQAALDAQTAEPQQITNTPQTSAPASDDGPETEETTAEPFDAATAPYLSQNDLIIVEGKGMYDGKVIS